jgi:DNA-binding transcriptional LysR family regulator
MVHVLGRLDISGVGKALREAALADLGIILQRALMLKQDITAGRLIQLCADAKAPIFPAHVIYLPERKLTAKFATFIDFVVERFGPGTE